MTAWYNEIDPKAAAWLRELIKQGHIAPGIVDERSIEDISPDDLAGFTQCHFFAGIGVWSYALRLAGWGDDRPVWTGSCPCQPLSQAGKGLGFADERHLWPSWEYLISERRPPVVFGEQVASKAADLWTDLVQDDMEALGYAFGAIPFPAASVGAPHIRDRLYWVGDYDDQGLEGRGLPASGRAGERTPWTASDFVWCRDGKWRPVEPGTFPLAHGTPERVGRLRGYGNAVVAQAAKIWIEAYLDARR